MPLISPRLTHVLTRSDLAQLLTPTYARELGVSDELAHERLARALKNQQLTDKIYESVSTALVAVQGSRSEDTLMNALSKAVPKKLEKMKATPTTPALAAVTVLLNIELGLAPATLRTTLETEQGRKLVEQGFAALGKHLVSSLVKSA